MNENAPGLPDPADRAAMRDQLLAAVEAIRPTLEMSADASEQDRTLAEPAWKALHDSGLFRLKAPRVLGGWEADPIVQIEVIEEVSRIDSSAGWTLMVGAGTLAGIIGWLPEEGVERFLVDGRLPMVAGGLVPSGVGTQVEGGLRVTGRWQFGSGSRHAEWFTGATVVEGHEPKVVFCNFPASDVTIHDTWFVGGLKGTGSEDFSVEDVFVPTELVHHHFVPARRGGPVFHIGIPGIFTNEHAAFALGVARRAIEETTETAKTRSRGYLAGQGIAARPVFQSDLGRCEQMLRAARALVFESYDSAWHHVLETGKPCPSEIQVDLRAAAAYATEVACYVTGRMFRHAGSRSLFSGNVIERCQRDVNAGAQHMMVSEEAYETRGKVLLEVGEVAPVR